MIEQAISTLQEFFDTVDSLKHGAFRGERKASWVLRPKLGRTPPKTSMADELPVLQFRSMATVYVGETLSDWQWMCLAQHHGVPTRLLDWSLSFPLAAYFAVQDASYDGSSAIYALSTSFMFETGDFRPRDEPGIAILPKHSNSRLAAQQGCFTYHDDPWTPFDSDTLTKYTIHSKLRVEIRNFIVKFGIAHSRVFPDLDGIAEQVNRDYEAAT